MRLLARPDPPVSDEEPGERGLSRLRALRDGGVDSVSFIAAGGELEAAALSVLGAALAAVTTADTAAVAPPPPRLAEDSRGGGLAGVRPPDAAGPGAQFRGVRRLPAEGVASVLPAAAGVAALLAVDAAEDDAPPLTDALLFVLA